MSQAEETAVAWSADGRLGAAAATGARRRRGWLVRRALLAADLVGLAAAFAIAQIVFHRMGSTDGYAVAAELAIFVVTLPAWIVVAKFEGLYDHDEERTDHTTVDDIVGVIHLVTLGSWLFFAGAWMTKLAHPQLLKVGLFWLLAVVLLPVARETARARCRRHESYVQNTVIVGADDAGQLVGRKILQHPEYGLNLVGFVDDHPSEQRLDLEHLALIGPTSELDNIVRAYDVDRAIVASSGQRDDELVGLIRTLREHEIQIDVVPRLFEVVGPNVEIHTVEGLPLVGLPPARISRSSRALKRTVDVVGASVALLLSAPLFAYIALRIKRDSPGPVFFRQERLGQNMEPFTALKFRTMRVDTDPDEHRDFVKALMQKTVAPQSNGVFKLERADAITPFGRWLRRTSLDELPQLINVLRGEMSLVGPRPCIPYETESFEPHHFERFLVPQGLTGLWQVTARAHSTFREALEFDVAYARGWSFGLDLLLLFKTPFQVVRTRGTA